MFLRLIICENLIHYGRLSLFCQHCPEVTYACFTLVDCHSKLFIQHASLACFNNEQLSMCKLAPRVGRRLELFLELELQS